MNRYLACKYALAKRLYDSCNPKNGTPWNYNNYYSSIEDALSYIDDILAVITDEIQSGNNVRLLGFGTFSVQHRKERPGRNPTTGEAVTIPSKHYVSFKSGAFLKRVVNDEPKECLATKRVHY